MKLKDVIKTRYFYWISLITAGLIVLLVIFNIGMFVGFRKADFSHRWKENYACNFGGPRDGFMREFERQPRKGFMNELKRFGDRGHMLPGGADGIIIKIDVSTSSPEISTLVVKDRDGSEKIIIATDKTEIRQYEKSIKAADLKIEDLALVIGEPNDLGQIEARFIRVFKK